MASTSPVAALYFIALMTFGNYVLFNLLVAILVEGFQTEVGQSSYDLPPTFTFCSPFVFLFCSPPSLPLPVFLILSIPLLLIIFQVCLFPLGYSRSFSSFSLRSPFSLMVFIFFSAGIDEFLFAFSLWEHQSHASSMLLLTSEHFVLHSSLHFLLCFFLWSYASTYHPTHSSYSSVADIQTERKQREEKDNPWINQTWRLYPCIIFGWRGFSLKRGADWLLRRFN